jgi:hypothetical protein
MAVGYGNRKTVLEHWDGRRWSTIASPNPAGYQTAQLAGISCMSTTFCMAVGNYTTDRTIVLVEKWNGTRWSIVATPNLPGRTPPEHAWWAYLNSVSCTSATNCTAVGATLPDYRSISTEHGLVERWDGTRWSVVTSPKAVGLDAVSCTSKSRCIAVGSQGTAYTNTTTLTEAWNGTRWSVIASPNVAGADTNRLDGVSCTAKHCMAVGTFTYTDNSTGEKFGRTLAEQWDGTRWAIVATPNPTDPDQSKYSNFRGVSCASATACFAVGISAPSVQLAEQYG